MMNKRDQIRIQNKGEQSDLTKVSTGKEKEEFENNLAKTDELVIKCSHQMDIIFEVYGKSNY